MEHKTAKITVEVEGEETEVYETNLFTLLVNQGDDTIAHTHAKKISLINLADHIFCIEKKLQALKEKYPDAASLLEKFKKAKAQKKDLTEAQEAKGEVEMRGEQTSPDEKIITQKSEDVKG